MDQHDTKELGIINRFSNQNKRICGKLFLTQKADLVRKLNILLFAIAFKSSVVWELPSMTVDRTYLTKKAICYEVSASYIFWNRRCMYVALDTY